MLYQKDYIILNPVAKDIRRMWPLGNYAGVADSLREKQMEVVFTGSSFDHEAIERIIAEMSHTAINACGVTLGGLAALMAGASLMISPDTGPLHMAQAVQCPTVGIYWAPNVINWAPLNRKIHRPLISWKLECPQCGVVPNDPHPFEPNNACKHEVSFVNDIRPDAVRAAANTLLSVARDGSQKDTENKMVCI